MSFLSIIKKQSPISLLCFPFHFFLDYYGNSIRIMLKEEKIERMAHFRQKNKILLRNLLGDFPLYLIGLNYDLPICKKAKKYLCNFPIP